MLKSFRLTSLTVALGAAFLAMVAIPGLKADQTWRTTVTFSGPVDIGGTELAAGTYIFRTIGEERNRVEIMNSDESHLVAVVDAVSAQAAAPSDDTRIELKEGAAGAPQTVDKWFYPGDTIGLEFLPPAPNTSPRPAD